MDRISSSAMLGEAADRMKTLRCSSLAVVENNLVIGRITAGDVARAMAAGMDPACTPVQTIVEQRHVESYP